jgi:hypothetical protein
MNNKQKRKYMLMKNLFYILSLFFLLTACSSFRLTDKEKDLIKNQVITHIENNDYTIRVNQADPMRWKTVSLTSEYKLTIRNDSAFALLPFFGRAYAAPYSSTEGGIKFEEKMQDYQAIRNKNGNGWEIRFKINLPNFNYHIFLSVFETGKTVIKVNSYQRDSITFYGEVELPAEIYNRKSAN